MSSKSLQDTNSNTNLFESLRQTIAEIGGVMPEDLPPEPEHIKKLEERVKTKRIGDGTKQIR